MKRLMKRLVIIAIAGLFLGMLGRVVYVFAGSLDSSAIPSDDTTRMYTIENIYKYLTEVNNPPPGKGTITGIAGSGSANTLVDTDLSAYIDDYFNGWTIEITAGTGSGETKTVSDFVSLTGTITVSVNWTTNPDGTSEYELSSTGFGEPATGPTATMHTLDDVFDKLQRIPATGQTTLYATGDDGDLKKGAEKRYQDNGDGTVTDLNTGLMWELKTNVGDIHDKDTTYTWANAFSVFIAGVNSANFAGHNDWRLPNVYELYSICLLEVGAITDVKATGAPYIDQSAFGNATGNFPGNSYWTQSSSYWSSTTYPSSTGYALFVYFSYGYVSSRNKTYSYYVRCVRGGQ